VLRIPQPCPLTPASVPLTQQNVHDVDFVGQYIFRAPDNFIAMGYSTLRGERDCPEDPEGLRCDALGWEIQGGEQRFLRPVGREGAWDAIKTREGRGWRLVWKGDRDTVQSEVRVSVVPFDE
jgi:hypothetical protein